MWGRRRCGCGETDCSLRMKGRERKPRRGREALAVGAQWAECRSANPKVGLILGHLPLSSSLLLSLKINK